MATNLFSTYRQGENRVTSTLMAVLQRLSLPNIDRILQALLDRDDFNLATFENQPSLTRGSRERSNGVMAYRERLVRSCEEVVQSTKSLLSCSLRTMRSPKICLNKLYGRTSWLLLAQLKRFLTMRTRILSEIEAFLLREFLSMLREDGLLISISQTRSWWFPRESRGPFTRNSMSIPGHIGQRFHPIQPYCILHKHENSGICT